MQQKKEIVFVFAEAHTSMGSKIMRCDQLCQIAQTHISDYNFTTASCPKPNRIKKQISFADSCRDKVVILLKGASLKFHPDAFYRLRRQVLALCVDYVDRAPIPEHTPYIDVHIAASHVGLRSLEKQLSKSGPLSRAPHSVIKLISHHSDPRLVQHPEPATMTLRTLYFGKPQNAEIPSSVSGEIALLSSQEKLDFTTMTANANTYNFHYGVRRSKPARKYPAACKPFTKGFTAAAMGRNILVNRQVHDAEHYLGADYPFLINSHEEDDIKNGLLKAQQLLGSPEWLQGLEVMKEIRYLSSPQRVASDLKATLASIL